MARPPSKTRIHFQIYNFLDYRVFLHELVKAMKLKKKDFTMRTFAESAGFGSPSYLKMVIDGQRKLTENSIERFCQALDITGREKNYFVTLVKYNQSVDPDEKKTLFEKLTDLRPRKTLTPIAKSQLKFYTTDYYSCIREMVLLEDFHEDAKWIAARCVPRISPAEARDAIDTLIKLDLLKRDESGKLVQTDSVVGTQAQAEVVEAFNFHESVLSKARNALSRVKQEERHFEALTIPVNPELAKILNQKITKLIDEALDEVNTDGQKYDEVYQLSVQFFPATTREHLYSPSMTRESVPAKDAATDPNRHQGTTYENAKSPGSDPDTDLKD
jgi:uncharacterized protein (TIGR02147 family)